MEEQSAARPSQSAAPAALGKYAPFARLGQGGMADVFLAVARGPVGFNKLTVVKRLRNPDDQERLDMFLDEARLTARLSHPNIVNTYEVGEARGQYFIAMEYLEGQPLHSLLAKAVTREKPLDETLAAFIAMQSLKGLHYAHELADYDGTPLHVVHRDVSPHNLFITYQGEVKLLDFGIAKAAMNVTQTETGVLKGKVRYMAPEQIADRNIDRRADVFALGIVLWEMLAGRGLFRGDVPSIVARMTTDDPPKLGTVRPEISPELEAIVAKALRRDLTARYQTADAMRADLEQFLRGRGDGADTALARILNSTFASMRDEVRARIKTFLADLPTAQAGGSGANLAEAADLLPALFGEGGGSGVSGGSGSGNRSKPTTASNDLFFASPLVSPSAVTHSGPRKSWWWALAAAALVVAVAVFALRGKHPPEDAPAASPSVVAPVAPVASTTTVHVETTPSGALVEWDGRPLARTPADVQLPPGSQTLKISAEGFESEDVTLEVKAETPTARTITLRSKEEPPAVAPIPAHEPPHPAGYAPPRARPTSPPPATTTPPASSASARPKIRVVGEDEAP